MITRHRDHRAIRRILDRRHRRRGDIHRRMRHVVLRLRRRGRVVLRALIDPALDQRDLRRVQRIGLLRHLRLAMRIRFDELQQIRLRRLPRHHGHRLFAALQQRRELRHDVIALLLRRLMAAIALRLEDRADVFVKRHRLRGVDAFIFLRRLRRGRHSRQNERGSEETILHGKGGLGAAKNGRKAAILASGACQGGIVHGGWWT